jgi:hypothetical protein
MTEVYFHCSDAEHYCIDRRGIVIDNLAQAHEHAERLARSLVMTPSVEDWRGWSLHVTDDLGEEIFVVSFASVLGKLH